MPKYKATFVRVERYISEIEISAEDRPTALERSYSLMESGLLEFDGEVSEADEFLDTIEEIQ